MKKKFGAKEVCGAVAVIGVLVCLLVYILVFNKYNELTEELTSQNNALEAQVNDMKVYYDKIPYYKENIETMKATIEQVTADYPGDAREEDVIMMAVRMQREALINFDKIGIESTKTIYSVPEDIVKGLNDDNLKTQIDFNAKHATYGCDTDYSNFKTAVSTVYDDAYRVGINTVSFKKSADDNNFIEGTIDITYYTLAGMNKEYTKPDMAEYISGVTDLFPAIEGDEDTVVVE
ncbi:MAG: hypothetical protein IJ794_20000 [Lachnospiraceae bacterium]|nr:hypothetical protein [Lachnospiraceae bacterium]